MAEKRRPAEDLLRERKDRLEKVYMNKKPDRVPFAIMTDAVLTANYAGFTVAEATSNYDAMLKIAIKWYDDFNVDGVDVPPGGLIQLTLGCGVLPFVVMDYLKEPLAITLTNNAHRILRDKFTKWPGVELPPDAHPQYIGGKFMEVEEYRKLAEDPITFMSEVVIPRSFEALSKPGSAEAYTALSKLGQDMYRYNVIMMMIGIEAVKRGWPSFPGGVALAPLDFIADFLRHVTYTMIDLRRHPEEVRLALEAVTKLMVKLLKFSTPRPEETEKLFGSKIVTVFMPLHLGDMLPPKLFEEFYWPGLKKLFLEAYSMGVIPSPVFDGDWTHHLHYLLELPKGSIFATFEKVDPRTVRRILGDHIPFSAGFSPSLYIYASKEKVFEEVCKLLNNVKEPGGYMFTPAGLPLPPSIKIENIWAAVEAVKKCGRYD
ncbi:MAG: uroporphyrinogen decarboxylase family protein [Ignisphaera sp.]|uniref:Uroporphyrinogen decarboxylase (URO-D) domain-containing protein n=1 Tax=Ignisphaera aggregans TaxID=334771 RepID=A0A7C4NKF4_9CREN